MELPEKVGLCGCANWIRRRQRGLVVCCTVYGCLVNRVLVGVPALRGWVLSPIRS